MATSLLFIYIGAHRVQVAWAAHATAKADLLFDEVFVPNVTAGEGQGLISALHGLLAACAAQPGLTKGFEAYVLLSDYWVPSASVPWDVQQLHSTSAAATSASDHIREAGHDLSAADVLRIDDAPYRQPRLAVAYPAMWLEHLNELISTAQGSLSSVITLAALAWSCEDASVSGAQDNDQVLAIVEPSLEKDFSNVILARGQRNTNSPEEVFTRPLPCLVAASESTVDAGVRTLLSRLGWSPIVGSEVQTVQSFTLMHMEANTGDQKLPAVLAWWTSTSLRQHVLSVHSLDAVARCARPSMVRRVVLAAMVCLIAWQGWSLWQTENRIQQEASVLVAVGQPASQGRTGMASPQDLRRISAVNAAVAQLNVPLPRLLHALEAPRDIRVALLGVEVSAPRATPTLARGQASIPASVQPTLKVHVESPSSVDMTHYVAFLSGRQPFVHAHLVRHEVVGAGAGQTNQQLTGSDAGAYRFTVEVTWKD